MSVFDLAGVDPPLTEEEVLLTFRPGSLLVPRSREDIEAKGLEVVAVPGGEALPPSLREAHAEIQPGTDMTRGHFKQALRELE